MEAHSREEMRALLEKAPAAIVATVDGDGYPHARAMLNLRHKEQWPGLAELFASPDDDFLVYFTTNTSSQKVAHLRANAKAAAYYHDPEAFRGLMLQGRAEIVDDVAVKRALWQEGWERYYPSGTYEDPDYTILRLRPALAKYYHGLRVTTLDLPGPK